MSKARSLQSLKYCGREKKGTAYSLLDKFSLASFICSCGRRNMPSFSLTILFIEKLACQLFNKATCQEKTCNFFPSTRANKTCEEKLATMWNLARVDDSILHLLSLVYFVKVMLHWSTCNADSQRTFSHEFADMLHF